MIVPPREVAAFDLTNDSLTDLFIATFCARTDLYVENGAEVRRMPITRELLRHAREHDYSVGSYMADPDGRTHVVALDIDREDGMQIAGAVNHLLGQHGIRPLIGESRRGAHLWLLLGPDTTNGHVRTVHAGLAHRFMRSVVALLPGDLHKDPKVEVFPHEHGGLGAGALRLPGMVNPKDHEEHPYYDADGTRVRGLLPLILAPDMVPFDVVSKFAGPGGLPYPPRTPYPKGWKHDFGDAPKASDIIGALIGQEVRPGTTVRCPRHPDKRRSLTVFKDDERVYCGSPSCVLNGGGRGVGSIELSKMETT